MSILKYTVIKSRKQYFEYCDILWSLLKREGEGKEIDNEIELLTLLIDTYDEEHNTFKESDPVELLTSIMSEHKMKAKDLAEILNVSKGLISDILNYKKGMSKDIIRKLAERFKLRQDAFNRPYPLITSATQKSKRPVTPIARKKPRVAKGKRKYHES